MRLFAFLALLALTPLTTSAQSDSAPRVGKNQGSGSKLHVKMQVDADHLALPLSITIKGKDRAAVDARAEAKSYVSRPTGGSKLFGDDEADKGDVTYVAHARWELHTEAEKGIKGLEVLRSKAADLVKAKDDDEKQVVGNPEYVLTNPQDYRNELLDQIKNDFEEAKKHLPEGQWTLELTNLAQSVDVVALGGKRFEVSLAYRMAFLTPPPQKGTK